MGSAILLGSPWEYDVPKCGQGVPGCSWECGTVSPGCTWVHTVTGSHMGQHTFVAFNPQCVCNGLEHTQASAAAAHLRQWLRSSPPVYSRMGLALFAHTHGLVDRISRLIWRIESRA